MNIEFLFTGNCAIAYMSNDIEARAWFLKIWLSHNICRYIFIIESCWDGCNAFPQKTWQRNQRKSGVCRGWGQSAAW